MRETRDIIKIDENKCNGCGDCILSCEEGAIKIIDGKAKLKGDIYCDGLGVCIGSCPKDALTIIKRRADSFDENAVKEMLKKEKTFRGCLGSEIKNLASQGTGKDKQFNLNNWPVKLKLIKPEAYFLRNSDFNLVADCVGVSSPDLHKKLYGNKIVAIGCPKLDNLDEHVNKLSKIIENSKLKSLSVFCMEVPCCSGFIHATKKSIEKSNSKIEKQCYYNIVNTKGEIIKKGVI